MVAMLIAQSRSHGAEPAPAKAPPERTYSKTPYVHRIPLLDETGTTLRAPRAEEGSATAPAASAAPTQPFSQQKTCGKCHSDYDVMAQGWHFNFADADAPHGRPGEPWILTDPQTRTQLPLSYRRWTGTFHPYDVGINDFNFARLFGRHHPGGGALAGSQDLRFKMSGALEIDCLICHTSDSRYDPAARAAAITDDQNFKYAPALAAFLGKVQGTAERLRDNYDPAGPDARRVPKVNYVWDRFDDLSQVHFDLSRNVPNERCYFCHTNIDAGNTRGSGNAAIETRWQHDGDIHLAKGMQCVDCHTHGADHMMVRGYEGEYADRVAAAGAGAGKPTVSKSVATLSCQGCHYGTEAQAGGRGAAPLPVHKGLPTLHFDLLSCTACHSGPAPSEQATLVQTAMAHKLGLPRHHTADAAAPTVQQPVFLRDEKTGKLAPYRVLYSSYWGRLAADGNVTPLAPEQVLAAGVDAILGRKADPKKFEPLAPLSEEQIAQVLEKLQTAKPVAVKPADVVSARTASPATKPASTTAAATRPATIAAAAPAAAGAAKTSSTTHPAAPTGEPVYVTGGRMYRRGEGQSLQVSDLPVELARYAWPLAHDVRPAQQSLGARGCIECHTNGAPIFDSTTDSAAVLTAASTRRPMHALRGDAMGALRTFAATYPLRPVLIVIASVSAVVLGLVLLAYAMRAVSAPSRGRGPAAIED